MITEARARKTKISSISRFAVKIMVSAGLMIFLLKWKISIEQIKVLLASLDRTLLVAGVSVMFMSNLIGSFQWHMLLKASGIMLPFHKTFRFYFVGLFFNNFLPANIGGDAVKIYDVTKIGSSVYQVIAVTFLDRLLGIFGLCLLATIATVYLINSGVEGFHILNLAIFIGCMIPAIGLYLFKPFSRLLRRLVRMIRPLSLDERISSVLDYLGEFKGRKALVVKLMALSIVIQSLRVITHILVGTSLGIHIYAQLIGQFFVFVPLLGIAMVPPYSISGFGVREGLGIILFGTAGIGKTDAFTMETLTYVVSAMVSLLGLLFFLMRRGEKRKLQE